MQIRTAAIIATATLLATPVLAADSTIYSKGGNTAKFADDRSRHAASGERFRIKGHCQSACTMFLALKNVCVEPSARLLFHAGANPAGTRRMMDSYNASLRAYLVANKIMETPKFTTIPGSTIISRFGYPKC